MPSSKKPRKAYVPKQRTSSIYMDRKAIEGVRDLFQRVEIACKLKIRQGLATWDDAACFRDALNLAQTIIYYEQMFLANGGLCGFTDRDQEKIERLCKSFHTWYFRGIEDGGIVYPEHGKGVPNPNVLFKCHGNEARDLTEGMEIIFDVIHAELDAHPQMILKLHRANHRILTNGAGRRPEHLHIGPDEMRKKLIAAMRAA